MGRYKYKKIEPVFDQCFAQNDRQFNQAERLAQAEGSGLIILQRI